MTRTRELSSRTRLLIAAGIIWCGRLDREGCRTIWHTENACVLKKRSARGGCGWVLCNDAGGHPSDVATEVEALEWLATTA